ncbi:MAG: nucleotidyl transferase AbiEii/AbiGii toxin family protein [Deltaproteobacteria bacterium]|nr:nucleotidyl transferase AbiEii/AbiGii toxin family protein [Deltaproteobacteria bacterium]
MSGTSGKSARSVKARLLRLAKERGEDFQLLLVRYANERLLYRLSVSSYREQFVLKGASLFVLWSGKPHRPTRDLDLLGFGDPGEARIRRIFGEIAAIPATDDGIEFDRGSLEVGPIREDQDYGGVRAVMLAHLDTARIRVQVDIGFGDAMTPDAENVELPALLDAPPPKIRIYSRETVVAEKLEAMVRLGLVNSRMKDFYDLAFLSRNFSFEGGLLVQAVRATFERRGTPLPDTLPEALGPSFYEDTGKQRQWAGFLKKSGLDGEPGLPSVIAEITGFVRPLIEAAKGTGKTWIARWRAGGPWRF